MLPMEECWFVAPTAGKEELDIENLGSIAGLRIPDIQPLVRAIVLSYLGGTQRLAPGKIRD